MKPHTLTSSASEYIATSSTGSPETSMPATSATTVTAEATITQRRKAAIA